MPLSGSSTLRLATMLLVACVVLATARFGGVALAENEAPPLKTPAATQAVAAFEQALTEAESRRLADADAAGQVLLAELEEAKKAAMKAGDLNEANALQAAIDRARPPAPAGGSPTTAPVAIKDPGVPKSPAARSAAAKHTRSLATAESEYRRAATTAQSKLLGELDAIKKTVLAGGDLAEANRLQAVIDANKPQAAAPRPQAARKPPPQQGRQSRIYLAVKGEAELFLNGKSIGRSKDFAAKPIDALLTTGDVIVIRASSPFVYRTFRMAIAPEDLQPIGLGRDNCRYLGELTPDQVTPAAIKAGKPVTPGRADPESPRRWAQTGGPDTGEWIGMPTSGKWYTYAFVVP